MKKVSGSGVKATQDRIAQYIREHQIKSWNLKDIKAREFVAETGIKAKKEEIVQMVSEEIARQDGISKERRESRYVYSAWHAGRILQMQQHKRENLAKWEELRQRAISLSAALTRTYKASWGHGATYINFGPHVLRITWDETSDWDYYSKSYGRPKNTYTNRRVELLAPSSTGNYFAITKTYDVDKFAGKFLVEAIAAFTGTAKVAVPKKLRPVQLNPYFEVALVKDIAGVQVYTRSIAGILVDYCAVRQGATYHAETARQAIDGLRKKLQAKAEHETEIINYALGRRMGFCDAGMRQFADDNGLDVDGSYSRAELRNIVIQRRELNASKYRRELAQIGISITN